jgi:tripeptidyl-peptidase-1
MKYAYFVSLLALTANAAKTSFVMPEDGSVERLRSVPEGWNEIGAPSADLKMRFRVAVRSVCSPSRHAEIVACLSSQCLN